jgi:hypothetical protein
MSLGGFFKKVTNIARAAGNPGGSAIRAAKGQPIVGHNSFKTVADPLNAVTPAPFPGSTMAPSGSYQPSYQPPAPTGSREQMVAAAIAQHGAPMPPPQQPMAPPPPMSGAPAPVTNQAPMAAPPAPPIGMMDPRKMAGVMRAM